MSALHVLQHHQMTPEVLLRHLHLHSINTSPFVLQDTHGDSWFFILRRRGRLFLMAKSSTMKTYEDIYSVSDYT